MASKSSPLQLISCQTQQNPWISVICICYNHQNYVLQALKSVVDQAYLATELIVIDNGSTDRTAERIDEFSQQYPSIQLIKNATNLGLNRAFNQGLALAHGQFIIDLSADDVLVPGRLAKQVAAFQQLPETYGVVFSNAAYIDANGRKTGFHYPVDVAGHALTTIPTGFIFREILASYFICTPTMMIRREVLDKLGGYDETLSYEDFDFWVRSSRLYQYAYLDEVLTLKRQLPNALSTRVVLPNNDLLPSTLIVCQKAFALCITPVEFQVLASRLKTFIRKAFYAEQFDLAEQFGHLLRQISRPDVGTNLILLISHLHLPVNKVYRWYLKFRSKPV
ncbi:glycosyltransferase [Spirosoma sp. HMF3257]|uniref:Glycosyltransferase family 2 protein n=1 Tax=Spirosoma telluris TaxID=2183553 RepID=A0A327NHI2_9BACT|nr:glycosyltransferase [Spirosoma telluris]RAI74255.1 glycosyltransferase family 2 protein [Spirosoma telluris]